MTKELYKLNANGSLLVWSVETYENRYRTLHGHFEGILTADDWVTCEPTNVGKNNHKNSHLVAIDKAESLIKEKIRLGYKESKEQALHGNIRFYPMLATDLKHIKTLKYPLYVQPKLDGVRCLIDHTGLTSRGNKKFDHLKFILEDDLVKALLEQGLVIDGELYNHKLKDDFDIISGLVRKTKLTAQETKDLKENIQYHIYDIYNPRNPNLGFNDRHKVLTIVYGKLKTDLKEFKYTKIVDTYIGARPSDIDLLEEKYVSEGYEGIMLRTFDGVYKNNSSSSRSKDLIKVKRFETKEYEILDVYNGQGAYETMAAKYRIENNGVSVLATIKATFEAKREIWQNKADYIGKPVTVRFLSETKEGSLRHPIALTVRDYE